MKSDACSIVTWNVNSIRARLDRLSAWLEQHQPEVVCVQETKVEDSAFPYEPLGNLGYDAAHFGQKTYNGVALLFRGRAQQVQKGFADGEAEDPQSRIIAATLPLNGIPTRIVSVYVPNGQSVGSEKYAYKLEWLKRFERYLKPLAASEMPLLVCGDYNIAPADLDTHDPRAWAGSLLCSEAERAAFASLRALGLADAFRALEPNTQAFSWWDYRAGSFRRNNGLRIDHFLVNAPAFARCKKVTIDREERAQENASDHAPVVLHWA